MQIYSDETGRWGVDGGTSFAPHGGAAADTETVEATVIEAGVAVAEVAGEQTSEVNAAGIQEIVADLGYHSNEVVRAMEELQVRSYIAEPERGLRNWEGKATAKAAVYANRRRVQDGRGKRLQRRRGERIERNTAHQFDTGGMDRLWVRDKGNVRKKAVIQAAASNLALLMRSLYGAGKPKAAHDEIQAAIWATLILLAVAGGVPESVRARRASDRSRSHSILFRRLRCSVARKSPV
jgi:hypothetical protein